jgi:putative membrane protein (TIGR04086 family)
MQNQRKAHNKIRKNKIKKDSAMDKTVKSSFLGILITVGIGFSLMLASTAAALLTDDPTAFVTPVGYVIGFVTAFFGGFICAKLNKSSPYLTGAICGIAFLLLSFLISLALPHSLNSEMKIGLLLLLHVAKLITFILGTFIGVKSATNMHKKRKRR